MAGITATDRINRLTERLDAQEAQGNEILSLLRALKDGNEEATPEPQEPATPPQQASIGRAAPAPKSVGRQAPQASGAPAGRVAPATRGQRGGKQKAEPKPGEGRFAVLTTAFKKSGAEDTDKIRLYTYRNEDCAPGDTAKPIPGLLEEIQAYRQVLYTEDRGRQSRFQPVKADQGDSHWYMPFKADNGDIHPSFPPMLLSALMEWLTAIEGTDNGTFVQTGIHDCATE